MFYAPNSIKLTAPLGVILLPHGVIVPSFFKNVHHIIHFGLLIPACVPFPSCLIHSDIHMVFVIMGILGFHFCGWMDCVVLLFQRFGQHSSPSTLVEPDPIVYHIFIILMKRSATLACVSVTTWVMPSSWEKKTCKFPLERHGHYHYKLTSWNQFYWKFVLVLAPSFSFIGMTSANWLKMFMTTNPYLGSSFWRGFLLQDFQLKKPYPLCQSDTQTSRTVRCRSLSLCIS